MALRKCAWMSEKGGTAKTTSAINVAVGLARAGHRVLMVDADPQANATLFFLRGLAADGPTLSHVLSYRDDDADADSIRETAASAIRPTSFERLAILPAEETLADVNVALAQVMAREFRLKTALVGIDEDYDFVVIDTSPQRTLLNLNVLSYVSEVYCTVDPGIYAMAGIGKLQSIATSVARHLHNPGLRIAGLVLTRMNRDNVSRDCESQLRATFGALVLKSKIPSSSKIGEAHARYSSVFDHAPGSPAAQAYEALTREVLEHGKQKRIGHSADGADQAADTAGRGGNRTRGRKAG